MNGPLLIFPKQNVGLAYDQLLDQLQKLRAILNDVLAELQAVMALLERTQDAPCDFEAESID
jgi:hypothetical protein